MAKYKHDRYFYHYYITLASGYELKSHYFKEEGFRSEEDAEAAMHRELIRLLQRGTKVKNERNSIGIRQYLRDRRLPTVPLSKGGYTYYHLRYNKYISGLEHIMIATKLTPVD